MLDHEDSRFGLALYALQLKVHEIEGTLVVSIPLDPLSKLADAPLGSQTHIEFRLDRRTQTLTVSIPEGMWEKGDKLVRGAAKTYAWKGGLPQLMKNGSIWPPHPVYGKRELDELPILCSLRFIVHRAGLWEKRDAETEAAASRLWEAVWRILYTAMNERAHSRAVRFGLSWDEYQVLHRRPDLCDFLDSAPGVGTLFREIPEDLSWEEKLEELLHGKDRSGTKRDLRKYTGNPAFQAWIRKVPYSETILPIEQVIHGRPLNLVWALLGSVGRAAKKGWFDAEGLERLKTPMQWLILNTALINNQPGQVARLLTDPEAGEAAFLESFRGLKNREKLWVADGLRRIQSWEMDAEKVAKRLAKWSRKLGRPDLAPSLRPGRLKRMDVVCRRVRRFEALLQHQVQERRGLFDIAMHAPVRVIREIIVQPDFEWREGTCTTLINRRGCRHDATIRPYLLKEATEPEDVLKLLQDGSPSETKLLWTRLAETEPRLAVLYLKKHGFDPRVGWQPEDLAPLFKKGGDVALDATTLLGELHDLLGAQRVNVETSKRSRTPPKR